MMFHLHKKNCFGILAPITRSLISHKVFFKIMVDNIIFLENPFGWSGYRTPYIVYNVKEDREYGNY